MGEGEQKVAIITGGSRGIGAGLVAAYRRKDWAVVANSLTITSSEDRDLLAVSGDITESVGKVYFVSDRGGARVQLRKFGSGLIDI